VPDEQAILKCMTSLSFAFKPWACTKLMTSAPPLKKLGGSGRFGKMTKISFSLGGNLSHLLGPRSGAYVYIQQPAASADGKTCCRVSEERKFFHILKHCQVSLTKSNQNFTAFVV